jgi:hypothetical protein
MRRGLLMSLGLLAIGCVSLKVQRMDEVVRPVQPPESVAVFLEKPDRPYTVIAVVESSYDGAFKGFDDLRRKIVAEAADLGGDALILGPESKKTGVMFVAAPVATPIFFDKKKLTGEVIKFD